MRVALGLIVMTALSGCLGIGTPKTEYVTNTQIVICPAELPSLDKRAFPEGRPSSVQDLQIAFLQAESAYTDLQAENESIKKTWNACRE